MACLGSSGEAKSPAYELTELPLAQSEKLEGRKLYRDWRPGHDYPVLKAAANNPRGHNGKTESHLKNEDGDVIKMKTFRQNTSSK
jgi:hypothetical protein